MDITINSVTHEELVNLFSTAFYGNDYMDADYDHGVWNSLGTKEGTSFEDHLADMILGGQPIEVLDYEADGAHYGNLPYTLDKSIVSYTVKLEDILKGITLEDGIQRFLDIQSGEGDMYTAWGLMQLILFGEEIYG